MDPTITITAEHKRSSGGGGNTYTNTHPSLRGSDEYAAAFDAEVWKAQQQARFRSQLRQAKDTLERRLRAELTDRDGRRIDELDATRRELEEMAWRLEAAGESLRRRSAQLEAREAAFEGRRVKVSEQHEAHLSRAETRARRAAEEASAALEAAARQLQEKDAALQQLARRLAVADGEYDTLRRRTARCLQDGGDGDDDSRDDDGGGSRGPVKAREAEARALRAERALQLMQAQLQDLGSLADRLSGDRDGLLRELHDSRMRTHGLERERDRLQRQCDELQGGSGRGGGGGGRGMGPARRQQQQQQKDATRAISGCGGAVAARGQDPLLGMLRELRLEVAGHATANVGAAPAAAGIVCEKGAPPPARVETVVNHRQKQQQQQQPQPQPQPQPPPPQQQPRQPAADPYMVVEEHGGQRAPTWRPTATATATAATTTTATVDDAGYISLAIPYGGGGGFEYAGDSNDDSNDSNDDMDDGPYTHVDMASYDSGEDEDDGAGATTTGGGVQWQRGGRSDTALPPLAPTATATSGSSGVSPSPEDFARAGTVSSQDADTTRAEMEVFVRRMKLNREKLLQTGVYTASHPIVLEMSEKISLYEQYLAKY